MSSQTNVSQLLPAVRLQNKSSLSIHRMIHWLHFKIKFLEVNIYFKGEKKKQGKKVIYKLVDQYKILMLGINVNNSIM